MAPSQEGGEAGPFPPELPGHRSAPAAKSHLPHVPLSMWGRYKLEVRLLDTTPAMVIVWDEEE